MNLMIMVMGLPGSGKSYFAARLAKHISAVHLQSDIVRKSMHLEGHYTPGDKLSVYQEMCKQAEGLLENGKSVVVDATFHLNTFRKIFFSMTSKFSIQVVTILVEADENTVKKRLERSRQYSEADYTTYIQLKKDFDPVLHPFLHLISTDANIDSMIHMVINYLKIGNGA